jgi:acetyl-CoA C-acetyltransferase
MALPRVAIVAARRTAVGKFGGSLAALPASSLGATVLKQLLADTKVSPSQVDDVIIGQILTGGCGMNPARQAAIQAGLPPESLAMTINKVCGSGLKSMHLAYQSIVLGESKIVVAGGQENMSLAPHVLPKSREGKMMGHWQADDSMIRDGLWCAFNDYHMGVTAENIAAEYSIGKKEQDAFAFASQEKAKAAHDAGKFKDQIVPVPIKKGRVESTFEVDEYIKHDASLASIEKLRPAFKKDGSVTAGNASGINDGAALVMIMSEETAKEQGLTPLAFIKSFGAAGVDPKIMGTGPIPAVEKALKQAGWSPADLDLVEANEAFAVQALSVNKGVGWDTEKVNVNGGAIAIGHPIGASGARIVVDLLYEMKRREAKKGLATLCIGGGQGVAMCFEAA